MDNNEFQAHTQQVEQLVQRVNALADENARGTALELLQSVMDFDGATLSRIVELLSENETHRASLSKLATDPLICGLLVLYGIHPMPLEQRVAQAVEKRASDIHLEPFEKEFRVRFRIDGVLYNQESPPREMKAAMISRVKLMAKLNIAERTVKFHVSNLLNKFGVRRRADLILLTFQRRLASQAV